jgi:hypothetical protein
MIYELVTIRDGKEVTRDTTTNYDAALVWFRSMVSNTIMMPSVGFQVIACPTPFPAPTAAQRSWIAMQS